MNNQFQGTENPCSPLNDIICLKAQVDLIHLVLIKELGPQILSVLDNWIKRFLKELVGTP